MPPADVAPRSRYEEVEPFVTKDGSVIRELMHPHAQGNRAQSLAEATVEPGSRTLLHRHRASEELYHVTAGEGVVTAGDEVIEVARGDTVCMPPGTPHRVENTGTGPLRFLCCSAPPYAHEDTDLLE